MAANGMAPERTNNARRARGLAWFAGALVLLAGLGALATRFWTRRPAAVEVGVFFPGTSADNWVNFLAGVRLAAAEKDLAVHESPESHSCLVDSSPVPVRFQWYPEVGSRGVQRRVSEICQRPRPPLAIVGANNSYLTGAIAGEMARHSRQDAIPVLLMTVATADALIDVLPERSFRFGFNNAFQARVVARGLEEFYRTRGIENPQVEAIVIQVLDNPFSMDLARNFRKQLRETVKPTFSPPPAGIFDAGMVDADGEEDGAVSFWSLETSTGGFDVPTEDERKLGREVVARMRAKPDKEWVIVLPVGTTPFRRFSFALHSALLEVGDAALARRLREHAVVLSGDSMDFHEFKEPIVNQLLPDETPTSLIFFAHVNPMDETVSDKPDGQTSDRSLDREVARALFQVLPELGADPTPAALAEALAEYRAAGAEEPFFRGRERHSGGGAIIAIPRPEHQDFDLRLPEDWRKTD